MVEAGLFMAERRRPVCQPLFRKLNIVARAARVRPARSRSDGAVTRSKRRARLARCGRRVPERIKKNPVRLAGRGGEQYLACRRTDVSAARPADASGYRTGQGIRPPRRARVLPR